MAFTINTNAKHGHDAAEAGDQLRKLSELFAVCGCEDEARSYIIAEIKDKCESVKTDVLGNVIAYKRGISPEKKVLIGTNIDEPGFIVTDITDDGYIKFGAVGRMDPRMLIAKRVVIGGDRIKGVIGIKAVHLTTREEREAAVKLSDMYIDIGAASKKKAIKRVRKGDYITFDTEFERSGECIKGKALDRFGTICLIEAMDETPAYDTYFVFSAQRETGGRGMMTAAYSVRPDVILIVDTPDPADVYRSEDVRARLGGGAVIEYMDRTNISDTAMTAAISKLAAAKKIKTQNMTASSGRTIAGAAGTAADGAPVACIGIPCRYSHTPVCMMNKNDLSAVSALCAVFVKEGVRI